MEIIKRYKLPLILAAIVMLAVWPFSFYVFPPKWDSIDCFLAYKYFWSNSVLEGHWPFWNPYQNLGYPGYSDFQNGLWNPISWLMVLLFGKYTVVSLSTEITLYFLIATLGVYKYSEIISTNKLVRFFCGISFGLCGFMVGTTQIMVFIMGIAWLPWILHFTRRLYQTSKFKYVLLLGLFVALETTSASPAFTIILVYILVAFIVCYVWKTTGNKVKLFGFYGLAGVISVVLVLPYLTSFLEFQPFFGRAEKLPYIPWVYEGSFDFAEYVSFVFPVSTLSKSDFWGTTNLTLRNGYFGIFGLAFFIFALVKSWKSFKTFAFLIIGLLFLALAAGDYLPAFKLAFNLPGFGTFRHPSFLRSHALLFFVLIAGIGFREFIANRNGFIYIIVGLFVLSLFGLFIGLNNGGGVNLGAVLNSILEYEGKPPFSTSTFLVLNAIILITLLFSFNEILKRATKNLPLIVIVFVVVDMGIVSQITSPTTIASGKETTKKFDEFFDRIPVEISQDPVNLPLNQIKERIPEYEPYPVWRNAGTFTKRISWDGFNPTQMKSITTLENNGGLQNVIKNTLFFTSKFVVDSAALAINPNTVWGTNIVNKELEVFDGLIGYNRFLMSVNNPSNQAGLVVVNQNYHDLWTAGIKGEDLQIIPVNDGLMGIEIPAKYSGQLWLNFDSPNTRFAFWISLFAYILLGLLLFLMLLIRPIIPVNQSV